MRELLHEVESNFSTNYLLMEKIEEKALMIKSDFKIGKYFYVGKESVTKYNA